MTNAASRDTLIGDTALSACMNKVDRLTNCIKIANLINSELSLARLLDRIMETTKKAFHADSVSLLLRDPDTCDLIFQVALGDVSDEIKELFRLKKGQGIAGLVAKTATPLNIRDVYDHPDFSPEYDRKTNYRTRAMLCVPLKARGNILGVIQVMNKLDPPHYFGGEELEMLMTIASSAAVAIDTAGMHKAILERQTLERDLALARDVQQSFLPAATPKIPGYAFAAMNQPALEIGGDFYNFFPLPANRLGIVLGDVSGKGISASLFMARLTSDLQYHALMSQSPSQLLETINDLLCERAQHGMFVTLVYICLDLGSGKMTFANAGHLFPVVSGMGPLECIGSEAAKGPPLGILPNLSFSQETFDLAPGSALTLYTDGITEAKNEAGELFGMPRLLAAMAHHQPKPSLQVDAVARAVERFCLGQGRSDDLTLLCVAREG